MGPAREGRGREVLCSQSSPLWPHKAETSCWILEHQQKAQPRASGLGKAEPWSLRTQASPLWEPGMVVGSFWGLETCCSTPPFGESGVRGSGAIWG